MKDVSEDRDQERFGEVILYSAKHPHEGKAQRQVCGKYKVVNYVDQETSSGTQISSRRRSSRTTLARLHRTCTRERHNTNLEEHNTADLYTKMFGWIENAVARKGT